MIGSAPLKLLRSLKLARATAKPEQLLLKFSIPQQQAGFTLLELLVVLIIIGAIAAIASPSWLIFINQRRVNTVNDTVLRALQDAQSQAKSKKVSYSVSFKTESGKAPEVAIYPAKQIDSTGNSVYVDATSASFKSWKNLGQDLAIKPGQVKVWTNVGTVVGSNNQANQVTRQTPDTSATNTGTITFDEMGALSQETNPNLGGTNSTPKGLIIMAAVPNGTNPIPFTQRCVKVKTLLGSLQIQKGDQCNF